MGIGRDFEQQRWKGSCSVGHNVSGLVGGGSACGTASGTEKAGLAARPGGGYRRLCNCGLGHWQCRGAAASILTQGGRVSCASSQDRNCRALCEMWGHLHLVRFAPALRVACMRVSLLLCVARCFRNAICSFVAGNDLVCSSRKQRLGVQPFWSQQQHADFWCAPCLFFPAGFFCICC